jgi:peptide/nickel transport system ATP-binding protein
VEFARCETIFKDPAHPYTRALLKSIPRLGSKAKEGLLSIEGSVPNPYELPSGCKFHPRCPDRIDGVCDRYEPGLTTIGAEHGVSCFLYSDPA